MPHLRLQGQDQAGVRVGLPEGDGLDRNRVRLFQRYDRATSKRRAKPGRKAQISTVRNLLGIPIDHFIEVTLVAFFQIATVVQPITVCLNDDTYDSFSGADFHKGVQQIDAAQAMAFVRQRRDVNDEMFTDLDRTRRQQAFIVSLLSALRTTGRCPVPATCTSCSTSRGRTSRWTPGWTCPASSSRPPRSPTAECRCTPCRSRRSPRTPPARTSTPSTCRRSGRSCTTSSPATRRQHGRRARQAAVVRQERATCRSDGHRPQRRQRVGLRGCSRQGCWRRSAAAASGQGKRPPPSPSPTRARSPTGRGPRPQARPWPVN